MNEVYQAQVRLMLELLPLVAQEEVFALKGGTAINFFVRDMPRLSVDIDLTYLPVDDRAASLAGISEGLTRIKARAEDRLPRNGSRPHAGSCSTSRSCCRKTRRSMQPGWGPSRRCSACPRHERSELWYVSRLPPKPLPAGLELRRRPARERVCGSSASAAGVPHQAHEGLALTLR